jgi:capsular exopolysaccharide synthesis family protein
MALFGRGGAPGLRSRRGVVDVAGPSAEPFRTLRLALELRPENRRGKTIVFTSAGQAEGKSTIATSYALVSSLSQSRVLLVDADLRHPAQHEAFGVPRAPGLVEVLGRRQTLEECVRSVQFLGHVDLLTAGTPVPRVADLMSSQAMMEFLETAAERYDAVIVDTPPILEAADAANLAVRADVDVALVVDAKGRRRAVSRALKKLELIDANVLGMILNREGTLSTYGYGYA